MFSGCTSFEECKKRNYDIGCVQDMRRLCNDSIYHFGYVLFFTGHKANKQYGVGIAICKPHRIMQYTITYTSGKD